MPKAKGIRRYAKRRPKSIKPGAHRKRCGKKKR